MPGCDACLLLAWLHRVLRLLPKPFHALCYANQTWCMLLCAEMAMQGRGTAGLPAGLPACVCDYNATGGLM